MKKFMTLTLGAVSLMASACNVDVGEAVEEGSVDTTEEAATCSNQEGVNSVMAAMAVASGNETRRWLPLRDLECEAATQWDTVDTNNDGILDPAPAGSAGAYAVDANNDGVADDPQKCIKYNAGSPKQWKLAVSGKADARCVPSRVCKNLEALMLLQNDAAQGMIVGGQALYPAILRDRLRSYRDKQALCQKNGGGNCLAPMYATGMPVEYHDVAFLSKSAGTCGDDYKYHACKMGTGPGALNSDGTWNGVACATMVKPGSLKNNLMAFGAPENQYLAFTVVNQTPDGSFVTIDPEGDLIGGGGSTTTSGSQTCAALATCPGAKYSATSLTGQCCVCGSPGVQKTFAPKTGFANWYVCQ